MNTENFKIQMTATQALHDKYGFCPAPQQVTLLESDGEGTYILFRVGEHEYRCENGEITNIEDQKKLDAELSANVELLRMRQRDLEELREQQEKQEKQFVTKELMLTEAYNALRKKMGNLKDECSRLREALDTDEESLQAMRGAIKDLKEANKCLTDQAEELKSTIHYRELALDKAAAKRDELETKNRQLCNDLAGERWTIRILKEKLEESQKLADQWFEEARKYQAERDEWEAQHTAVAAARKTAAYRTSRLED